MARFTEQEVRSALAQNREPYRFESHSWVMMKRIGKNKCDGCGLLALRNPMSLWSVKRGCYYPDAPGYKTALKRLTR